MTRTTLAALAAIVLLSACEKPQTATAAKPDTQPWTGAQDPYVAPGWKAGDQASWEQQMQKRAQAQNEYARTPVTQ